MLYVYNLKIGCKLYIHIQLSLVAIKIYVVKLPHNFSVSPETIQVQIFLICTALGCEKGEERQGERERAEKETRKGEVEIHYFSVSLLSLPPLSFCPSFFLKILTFQIGKVPKQQRGYKRETLSLSPFSLPLSLSHVCTMLSCLSPALHTYRREKKGEGKEREKDKLKKQKLCWRSKKRKWGLI
jgi:hypothetical protein